MPDPRLSVVVIEATVAAVVVVVVGILVDDVVNVVVLVTVHVCPADVLGSWGVGDDETTVVEGVVLVTTAVPPGAISAEPELSPSNARSPTSRRSD